MTCNGTTLAVEALLQRYEWAHVEQVNRGRDVVLVVLDRDLAALADRLERRDVDDAPYAALGLVLVEDLLDVALDRDVAAVDLDLERLLVVVGRVGGKRILRNLGDTLERSRVRVVEAVRRWRDEARRDESDNMRVCDSQRLSGRATTRCTRGNCSTMSGLAGGSRTHLSMVTTLNLPDSRQHRAMCEPARQCVIGQCRAPCVMRGMRVPM